MIVIDEARQPSVEELSVEFVERKGLGHPDTISDALVEEFSIALCNYYLDHFGRILHHNVDKALLAAGKVKVAFGGGEMEEKIDFIVVGRATSVVNGKKVPVEDLYYECVKKWIRNNFRHLDPDRHINFSVIARPGSVDLTKLFEKGTQIPVSNDTSFGAGYAPMSRLEKLVLEAEEYLNSPEFKKRYPQVGEDVKVMGVRIGDRFRITIAAAFVASLVKSASEYKELKEQVRKETEERLKNIFGENLVVELNTADDEKNGICYITLTGTSAEQGDDGQVGRGNRANGLITPMRPMSLEATAGKNPVSHVGKLYNAVAFEAAEKLVETYEEIEEAYIYLVSQIGAPVTEPQAVKVDIRTKNGKLLADGLRQEVSKFMERQLKERLLELWKDILERKVRLY